MPINLSIAAVSAVLLTSFFLSRTIK